MLAVAAVVVALLLTFSIYLVRARRAYRVHKYLQISTSALLLIVLLLFEVEVRLHGWQEYALASPVYAHLHPLLYTHITIACATTVLWTITLILALRRFASPPHPSAYSQNHKRLAKVTSCAMYLTVASGVLFFYLAFIV